SLKDDSTNLPAFFMAYGIDLICIKEMRVGDKGKISDFVKRPEILVLDPDILILHARQSTNTDADLRNAHPAGSYFWMDPRQESDEGIGRYELSRRTHSIVGVCNGQLNDKPSHEEEQREKGVIISTQCDTQNHVITIGMKIQEKVRDHNSIGQLVEVLSTLHAEASGPHILPAVFDDKFILLTDRGGERPGLIYTQDGVTVIASQVDAIANTFGGNIDAAMPIPVGSQAAIVIQPYKGKVQKRETPLSEIVSEPSKPIQVIQGGGENSRNLIIVDASQLKGIPITHPDFYKLMEQLYGIHFDPTSSRQRDQAVYKRLEEVRARAMQFGATSDIMPMGGAILNQVLKDAMAAGADVRIENQIGIANLGILPFLTGSPYMTVTTNGVSGRKLLWFTDGSLRWKQYGSIDEEGCQGLGPHAKVYIRGNAQTNFAIKSRGGIFLDGHAAANAFAGVHSASEGEQNRLVEPVPMKSLVGIVTNYTVIGGITDYKPGDTMYEGIGIICGNRYGREDRIYPRECVAMATNNQYGIVYFNSARIPENIGRGTICVPLIAEDELLMRAIIQDIATAHNLPIAYVEERFGNLQDYLKIIPNHVTIRASADGTTKKDESIEVILTGTELFTQHLRAVQDPQQLGLLPDFVVTPNIFPLLTLPQDTQRYLVERGLRVVEYPVTPLEGAGRD
ncbi:hypothetical protein J4206_03615, partial [Candidatus Woesearchaeota archaeon]|nr:hypothetical protein [Candidatus Woesearchaeota archaeon]